MPVRRALFNCLALVAGIVVAFGCAEIATKIVAPQKFAESWYVYRPQGILVSRPSSIARHDIAGRIITYEINSWSQRNREEPDPTTIRVLMLGDSFTHGIGLALRDTYVDRPQKRLDARAGGGKFQLLNAGTGGWGRPINWPIWRPSAMTCAHRPS